MQESPSGGGLPQSAPTSDLRMSCQYQADTTLSWKGKHHPSEHKCHAQKGEENGGPILEPFNRRLF